MSDWHKPSAQDFALLEVQTRATDGLFDFNNIVQTYKHLLLVGSLRSAAAAAGRDYVEVNLNGDFGANYQEFLAEMTSIGLLTQANAGGTTRMRIGIIRENGAPAGFDPFTVYFANYTVAKAQVPMSDVASREAGARGRGWGFGEWATAAAITRIQARAHDGAAAQNFLTGSVMSLYGLR